MVLGMNGMNVPGVADASPHQSGTLYTLVQTQIVSYLVISYSPGKHILISPLPKRHPESSVYVINRARKLRKYPFLILCLKTGPNIICRGIWARGEYRQN